jgi:hypothetical protein
MCKPQVVQKYWKLVFILCTFANIEILVQSQYCSQSNIPFNFMLHNLEYVKIQNVKVIFKSQVHIVILIVNERFNYATSKNQLLFDEIRLLMQVLSWWRKKRIGSPSGLGLITNYKNPNFSRMLRGSLQKGWIPSMIWQRKMSLQWILPNSLAMSGPSSLIIHYWTGKHEKKLKLFIGRSMELVILQALSWWVGLWRGGQHIEMDTQLIG